MPSVRNRAVVGVLAACSLGNYAASASFVGYSVRSTETSLDGKNLVVYTLTARFDGATDTVHRALNLSTDNSSWLQGFWHKDNHGSVLTNGVLSQDFGTWNPRKTGSNLANRPYDSYLTIGGIARSTNITQSEGTWFDGGQMSQRFWDQAELPTGSAFSWYNEESSSIYTDTNSIQGRVGNSPGVADTDVRLGQFVLSEGHEARTFSLSILFSSGHALTDGRSGGYQVGTGTFTLGEPVPGPGAIVVAVVGVLFQRNRRR